MNPIPYTSTAPCRDVDVRFLVGPIASIVTPQRLGTTIALKPQNLMIVTIGRCNPAHAAV